MVPQPGSNDPHVQSIAYEPEQVVSLRVALGYATSIQFGADERIENVVVGNSSAWQVTPNRRGDHLFVKPTQGATDTNLEVIKGRLEILEQLLLGLKTVAPQQPAAKKKRADARKAKPKEPKDKGGLVLAFTKAGDGPKATDD